LAIVVGYLFDMVAFNYTMTVPEIAGSAIIILSSGVVFGIKIKHEDKEGPK
jgi:hypothetical protein